MLHKDDSSVHMVITTFELKASKSRDGVSILGKVPVLAQPAVGASGQAPLVSSRDLLFPSREVEAELSWKLCCVISLIKWWSA